MRFLIFLSVVVLAMEALQHFGRAGTPYPHDCTIRLQVANRNREIYITDPEARRKAAEKVHVIVQGFAFGIKLVAVYVLTRCLITAVP